MFEGLVTVDIRNLCYGVLFLELMLMNSILQSISLHIGYVFECIFAPSHLHLPPVCVFSALSHHPTFLTSPKDFSLAQTLRLAFVHTMAPGGVGTEAHSEKKIISWKLKDVHPFGCCPSQKQWPAGVAIVLGGGDLCKINFANC